MVSISLITYNHAPYIAECLDSLLIQKTDFPYEIVVGEDESSDGTREICEEYAKRHPDKIRLIERSQHTPGRSKFASQGVYNFIETMKDSLAPFSALCDGDDMWTDTSKLQQQYDIMRTHPNVSLVHSAYDSLNVQSGQKKKHHSPSKHHSTKASRCDVILRDYEIGASTAFVRTADLLDIFNKNLELFQQLPMGDTPCWSELLDYGDFHFIKKVQAIYRILPESDSNSISAEKRFRFINNAANLGLMLTKKHDLPMKRIRAEKIKNCNRYALLSGDHNEINKLYTDQSFHFSFIENVLYHSTKVPVTRAIAKRLFELRYAINNQSPKNNKVQSI